MKQSTAANKMVFMVDSTDHVTGKTGLTLTITASKDGAAFASISPTVTDRGNGWYNVALSTTDTNTLGDLALHITGTGADPTDLKYTIEAGALDADITSRMATYTQPTGFLAATFPTGTVANTTNITAGTISTVTTVTNQLTAAQIATGVWTDTTAGDFTVNSSIGKSVMNGVALGTGLTIVSVSGSVGSVTGGATSAALASAQIDLTALVGRLTSTRAIYLDNLSAGAVALASTLSTVASYIDTEVAAIKAKTDNLPADPASDTNIGIIYGLIDTALTTLQTTTESLAADDYADYNPTTHSLRSLYQSMLTTNIKLDTIDDYIDTEVAAIKAKTDLIVAFPANFGDLAITSEDGFVFAVSDTGQGLATAANLATVATYIDTEVAAIKVVTDRLSTALVVDGGVYQFTANALELAPSSGGGGTTIDDTVANMIADHVLRRSWQTAHDSADGDTVTHRSLLGMMARQVNKWAVSGSNLLVYESDDESLFVTVVLSSVSSATPIVGMDPPA